MRSMVIYRTGGTENFKWNAVAGTFTSSRHADQEAQEIRRMGYKAITITVAEFEANGLPKTYNADEYFPKVTK